MTAPPPPRAPSPLQSLIRQQEALPVRGILYGESGVGKSTLAVEVAAKPLLVIECFPESIGNELTQRVLAEGGYMLQRPRCWAHLLQVLTTISRESDVPFKSLLIDGLNFVEGWCHDAVIADSPQVKAEDGGKRKAISINESWGGYKGGEKVMASYWRGLLNQLELVRDRGLQIWLAGQQSQAKEVTPEATIEYKINAPAERYDLATICVGWSDITLYLRHEKNAFRLDPTSTRSKGKLGSVGSRIAQTVMNGAWMAKNRFGLPSQLDLEEGGAHVIIEAIGAK